VQASLIGLFMLSGMAGLVYQVVWVRQFTQVLGASTHAVTVILAAFMAGLGLGAWLVGRRADRLGGRGLVRAYVLLELGIGLYSLCLPALLDWSQAGYVAFFHAWQPSALAYNGLRLVAAFALLLVPTTFMGATLPVLGRFLIRNDRRISLGISRLYAANTIGALAGVLLAGFWLLPALGNLATTLVAVGANFFVAGAFWLVARKAGAGGAPPVRPAPADTARPLDPLQKAAVLGLFASGMAAMFYEVAWTRTLAMILGTTTYAFSTMLATFLLGIGLGSALYGLAPRRLSRSGLLVGLQLACAASVLATIPLFEKLPLIFLSLEPLWGGSWQVLQAARFLLAGMVMLAPTLALGAMLPVVSALFVEHTGHLSGRVGQAYGLNTLGNVLGAALAGLVLIPLVGMQHTILAGAALNLAAAVALLALPGRWRAPARAAGLAAAGAVVAVGLAAAQPWSPWVINSGVYVYAPRYQQVLDRYRQAADQLEKVPELAPWRIWELAMKQYELLYYRTGATATVAVMERDDGVRFMTIDGKTDASTSADSDLVTQKLIAHLPLSFSPQADKVLVMGLGSGVTAGAALTHPVRVVDCAEISSSVVGASRYFARENHHALQDPRLRLFRRDARNLLLTAEARYDVVISQPSNPWISGESSLFSRQWYQAVDRRLVRGGLLLQWVPGYLIGERDLKIILRTMRSVFPYLTVWSGGVTGDIIFLASKGRPLTIDYRRFLQRVRRPPVRQDLAGLGLEPERLPLELFLMGPERVSRYLRGSQDLPLNTDDRLVLEFSTPQRLIDRHRTRIFQRIREQADPPHKIYDILSNYDRGAG
jgi:spermidine synthase